MDDPSDPTQTQYAAPVPTVQNPQQSGSNLTNILQALHSSSQNQPPSNSQNSSGWGNVFNSFNQGLNKGINMYNNMSNLASNYGGVNYKNFIPGVSGPDAASAAQAGVQSGLSFDPTTGDVF